LKRHLEPPVVHGLGWIPSGSLLLSVEQAGKKQPEVRNEGSMRVVYKAAAGHKRKRISRERPHKNSLGASKSKEDRQGASLRVGKENRG